MNVVLGLLKNTMFRIGNSCRTLPHSKLQQGQYNPITRAVESYLYSTQDQTVHIKALNKDFHFKAWEAMQTEQSFKYTLEEMESLAVENGFEVVEHLFDSRKYFVDSVWKVAH